MNHWRPHWQHCSRNGQFQTGVRIRMQDRNKPKMQPFLRKFGLKYPMGQCWNKEKTQNWHWEIRLSNGKGILMEIQFINNFLTNSDQIRAKMCAPCSILFNFHYKVWFWNHDWIIPLFQHLRWPSKQIYFKLPPRQEVSWKITISLLAAPLDSTSRYGIHGMKLLHWPYILFLTKPRASSARVPKR